MEHKRSFRKITIEEAKKYSPMFGYELLETCPQCEFYLVIEQGRLGKPERIVSMVFECERRREERERRRRDRELGKHVLIYGYECESKQCYLLKEITKSSEKHVDL